MALSDLDSYQDSDTAADSDQKMQKTDSNLDPD